MSHKPKDTKPKAIEPKSLANALELDETELPLEPVVQEPAGVPEATVSEAPVETVEVVAPVKAPTEPQVPVLKEGDTLVTDEATGKTLFIKRAPTHDANGKPKGSVVPAKKARIRMPDIGAMYGINANPALIQFPSDRWGVTKDFKAAVLELGSRINGDPGKKELADQVIKIALGYLEAKYKQDKALKDKRGV